MPVLETLVTNEALPDQQRDDIWQEMISPVFDVTPHHRGNDQGRSTINSYCYGELILAECETYGQTFMRDAKRLSTDPIDHILVQLYLQGGSYSRRGTERIDITPG